MRVLRLGSRLSWIGAAGACALLAIALAFDARAAEPALQASGGVGSCTPELVYRSFPGSADVRGAGSGEVAELLLSDASGALLPPTSATVDWTVRAVVEEARDIGARPRIGGGLELELTTAAGHRLSFRALCVAGAGAYPGGLVFYANGLTRGWPGEPSVRHSFVHFEAWTEGGVTYAYVAMLDGRDCGLDASVRAVTQEPYAVGAGSFSEFPPTLVYAETSCALRFGSPFPASLAPGLGGG